MPVSRDINSTALWPGLAETLAEGARPRVLLRETAGADVMMRTLDRAGGMERTGADDYERRVFNGSAAGRSADLAAGEAVARNLDAAREVRTAHLGVGAILDTST